MKDINILVNNGVNVDGSLEILGDMEMYDETMSDFLDEVEEKIESIKTYKDEGDMPNYAIQVHSLKSDSKYLGFTTLAELSYNHEMASKGNDVNFVNDNFDSSMEEADRIVNLCKEYMGR